jgi:hypothetical protein
MEAGGCCASTDQTNPATARTAAKPTPRYDFITDPSSSALAPSDLGLAATLLEVANELLFILNGPLPGSRKNQPILLPRL